MKYYIAQSVMTEPLPVSAEELERVYLPAHADHVRRGTESGTVLLGGPNELGGGFLVLRAESRAALDAFLAADPLQVHGLNRFAVTEFFPKDRSAAVQDW